MSQSFSFDSIASVYDTLSYFAFGGRIQRAQQYFLNIIPPYSKILIIGGGSGDILIDLLEKVTASQITYVEVSKVMLYRAKKKLANYRRTKPNQSAPTIIFVNGTEDSIDLTEKYQVVITNFVLDMYQGGSLDAMMQRIDGLLSADAMWVFTDFCYSSHWQRRLWQKPLALLMYLFFHFTASISIQSLPDYDSHFRKLGWRAEQYQSFFGDFISSRVYVRAKQLIQDDSSLNS